MDKSRTYSIVKGPNKDMILDAFNYNRHQVVIPIKFDVVVGYSAPPTTDSCISYLLDINTFTIQEIGYVEESENDLRIGGELFARFGPTEEYLPYSFTIKRYNCKTKRGEICLERKSAIIKSSSR